MVVRWIYCGLWRIRYYGYENVPKTGGVLLAGNHQSYLDPPAIGSGCRREVSFMARSTLFKNWLFGPLIRSVNAMPVERDKPGVGEIKAAIEKLRNGAVMLVFPEGTRSRDGKVKRMKPGIGLLARKAGVPIVPALIEGAYQVWPPGRLLPAGGVINVTYGPPFHPGGLSEEDLAVEIRQRVLDLRNCPRRKAGAGMDHGE